MSALPRIDLRDASSFPSRRTEAWKYSDLRRWLRQAPEPSGVGELTGDGPFAALGGEVLAFVNGRALGADAFVASGEQVLRLRFASDAEGTGHETLVRISARAGARLLLLESHEGRGSGYVAHNRLEIDVADGAEVVRIVLAEEAEDAISIGQALIRLSPGGAFRQTVLAAGARLQRLETEVRHAGRGADARLDGAYVLAGSRHADLTTVVVHEGRDGTTSQLTKGVVGEAGRGVFQGKIVVERGADGTDARMAHHALILSERGEINGKPELIIYADEVQCAHGNTVGALDEDALFYMQQRGLSAEEARALLTTAFLMEVVDRIEPSEAREVVREWLMARL